MLITIIKYIKSVKEKKKKLWKEEGVSTIKYKQAVCFRAGKGGRERVHENGKAYSIENVNTAQNEGWLILVQSEPLKG